MLLEDIIKPKSLFGRLASCLVLSIIFGLIFTAVEMYYFHKLGL